jgi:hypothetical protein
MQIILTHEEFLLLQRINAKVPELTKYFVSSRTRADVRILSLLWESGLIGAAGSLYRHPTATLDTGGHTQLFGPITITPLGKRVLAKHTPWVDTYNKGGGVWGTGPYKGLTKIGQADNFYQPYELT